MDHARLQRFLLSARVRCGDSCLGNLPPTGPASAGMSANSSQQQGLLTFRLQEDPGRRFWKFLFNFYNLSSL